MKKTVKRIAPARLFSLVLALVFLAVSLVGCMPSDKLGDYTVNTEVVMKVNGYKVTHDEYRCFYLSAKEDIENGDGTIWYDEDAPFDELKRKTEFSLRRKYALKTLIKKYGIKLTDKDKTEIEDTVAYYIEEKGGQTGYRQWLASGGMTGRIFREQYELVYYYDEYLRDILFTGIDDVIKVDDKTVSQDIHENFYHYTWIFIPFDENDNYTTNGDKAMEAFEALEDGEDFYAVAEKYSEWTGNEKNGIYATKGEKLALIEDTVLGLDYGEYSRVLATTEGHAIVMRLQMDEDYINDNFDKFVFQSATRRYNELLDNMAEEMEVEYTKYYDTLTMDILTSNDGYFGKTEKG
ncbi:MAG: SurA N-terminal domain-containing protein [Clostridia bacterium]|nr:SurA N-terminal domain-containing protein [Clostridia bacterium]